MSISAENKFLLDRMNSTAQKTQLGTLLDTMSAATDAVTGSHRVLAAGKHTSVGGDAVEAITVTGVAATDVVLVTLQTEGVTPRSIVKAVPSTNTITVTMSGDPSTDHIIAYQVLRAV
jgi:hypothetical protein